MGQRTLSIKVCTNLTLQCSYYVALPLPSIYRRCIQGQIVYSVSLIVSCQALLCEAQVYSSNAACHTPCMSTASWEIYFTIQYIC